MELGLGAYARRQIHDNKRTNLSGATPLRLALEFVKSQFQGNVRNWMKPAFETGRFERVPDVEGPATIRRFFLEV